VALVVALGAGCADDVAPAAQIGDVSVTTDELFDELDQWASSPTLLAQLQVGSLRGASPESYDMQFVDFVLSNRISFVLHNEQFDALGLDLSDAELAEVRASLFANPGITAAVLGELSTEYGDNLVADVARQFAVNRTLGESYNQWSADAFTTTDVEINPQFGTWAQSTGSIEPPPGPRPAPIADPFADPSADPSTEPAAGP
jgi:hypothetical protein